MTYSDVPLGQLTAPGTDIGRVTLEYVSDLGGKRIEGTISVVPETSAFAVLIVAAVGIAVSGRRRRSLRRPVDRRRPGFIARWLKS